jgi:hypothetical protein
VKVVVAALHMLIHTFQGLVRVLGRKLRGGGGAENRQSLSLFPCLHFLSARGPSRHEGTGGRGEPGKVGLELGTRHLLWFRGSW